MRGNTRNHGDPKHLVVNRPLVRYSNIHKITSSAGALKGISHTIYGRQNAVPAIGDLSYIDFYCDGTETILQIDNHKAQDCAKWDLWVNGVQDSTGYDDYAAASDVHRAITLTQPIIQGVNTLILKATTKNAGSSNYNIQVYGASLE